MNLPDLNCVICGKKAAGVCSSQMGPVSHAYCSECLYFHREEWNTLIGGLFGLDKDSTADWVKPIIIATCEFYNRTEEELWNAVDKATEDYEDYCSKSAR